MPALWHLLHGYRLSHRTFRCAQTVQLRAFSEGPEALASDDDGSLDVLLFDGPAPLSVLAADIQRGYQHQYSRL